MDMMESRTPRRTLIDRLIAGETPYLCSLLEVSGGASGGGGGGSPGGGPPLSMLYVAPGGNDTTGNGSLALPFLTIGKAMTVAAPLASTSTPYTILTAPGTYAEAPALPAHISLVGLNASQPSVISGGPVTIAPGFVAGGSTGVTNMVLTGGLVADFGGATTPSLKMTNTTMAGLSVTGSGAGIGVSLLNSSIPSGAISLTNVSNLLTRGTTFVPPTAVVATTSSTAWDSSGDTLGDVAITAAPAFTVSASMISTVTGDLALTGAGVTYTAPIAAIPPTVTLASGAPAPTPTPGPSLPTRGLTLSMQAKLGISPSAGPVRMWRDQARVGLYLAYSGGGAGLAVGASINGNPTLDFSDASTDSFNYNLGAEQPWTLSTIYSENELSIAAVFQYTGANDSTADIAHTPTIIGDNSGAALSTSAGLSVGVDSGATNKVFITFWVSNNVLNEPLKVVSVPVLKANAHYVVATLKAGTMTLYVDALAPVTQGGLGEIDTGELENRFFVIGGNNYAASGYLNGPLLEVDTWNVGLTPTEVAQTQAWLKSVSGL